MPTNTCQDRTLLAGLSRGGGGVGPVGATGPTGPTGPTGATGPTGPGSYVADIIGGSGEDGAATFNGSNTFSFATLAGSTYTLTRHVMLSTMKITTGITLRSNTFQICAQTWDCTSGFYGQISVAGSVGTDAVNQNRGSAGAAATTGTAYFATAGAAGPLGSNGVNTGNSTGGTNGTSLGASWGGDGSSGGKGGNGSTGVSGTV